MNNKYKAAALARGADRTAEIETKITRAMEVIATEMRANNGIYPSNGGAVSKNEVARRAGIGKTTLFAAKQRELSATVDAWLQALRAGSVVGRGKAQRTYSERVEAWRERYLALEANYRRVELELQAAESQLESVLASVLELQSQNAILSQMLVAANGSNVLGFPSQKK